MKKVPGVHPLENGVYIVQDGETIRLQPKEFGREIIIWQNGQVLDVEQVKRIRIKQKNIEVH